MRWRAAANETATLVELTDLLHVWGSRKRDHSGLFVYIEIQGYLISREILTVGTYLTLPYSGKRRNGTPSSTSPIRAAFLCGADDRINNNNNIFQSRVSSPGRHFGSALL